MIAELKVRSAYVLLAVFGLCALSAPGCDDNDVAIETLTEDRQTLSPGDEVVQQMRSPSEPLIYDKPVNLAKPAPADSIPRSADTTHAARDTTR